MRSLAEAKARLLANKATRAEYKAQSQEFAIARELIADAPGGPFSPVMLAYIGSDRRPRWVEDRRWDAAIAGARGGHADNTRFAFDFFIACSPYPPPELVVFVSECFGQWRAADYRKDAAPRSFRLSMPSHRERSEGVQLRHEKAIVEFLRLRQRLSTREKAIEAAGKIASLSADTVRPLLRGLTNPAVPLTPAQERAIKHLALDLRFQAPSCGPDDLLLEWLGTEIFAKWQKHQRLRQRWMKKQAATRRKERKPSE